MPERTVVVADPVGLHARPAAAFAKAAASSEVAVTVGRTDGVPVDARSVVAVMSLGIRQGETVVLSADGDGALDVLDRLAALIQGGGDPR